MVKNLIGVVRQEFGLGIGQLFRLEYIIGGRTKIPGVFCFGMNRLTQRIGDRYLEADNWLIEMVHGRCEVIKDDV
ncbi:MAG: hypothetical protein IKW14_05935 [Phascolarctobacterium sp.]|nr:hypothetical protein [Phascolarctobacterium sp.]